MKKFNVSKSELMTGKYLIHEDGFISNGAWALNEKYVLVRKCLNAEMVTLKEIGKLKNLLLNPAWNTLKDLLMLDRETYKNRIYVEIDNDKPYVKLPVNNDYSVIMSKFDYNRIIKMTPGIEFYHNNKKNNQIQIVLNNEVIGVFVSRC